MKCKTHWINSSYQNADVTKLFDQESALMDSKSVSWSAMVQFLQKQYRDTIIKTITPFSSNHMHQKQQQQYFKESYYQR